MGLRNNEAKANAAFETEAGAAAGTAEAIQEPTVGLDLPLSEEEQAQATRIATQVVNAEPIAPSSSTAVAPLPKRDLASVIGNKYRPALEEFKNVIDPTTLDFDTFPRVTVGLDGFSDSAEEPLGKQIKLRLMSWHERYIVTAGEDSDEANALTRFSLDGVHLDDDGTLARDYVTRLKETEGYENADIKKYYQIYGFLLADSKTGPLTEIDPEDQGIVSIQVPPRSVAQFTRYQIEQGVKVSQGIVQASDELVLTQQKEKGKTKSYAKILFSRK